MSGPGCVGFFGKLPNVGDFVQRRLPPDFVAAWDAGFEAAVDAARAKFGGNWQALWRTGPAWRFALAPGVCGGSAWVGLMGPSVDRVGRGFPMVLATVVRDASALDRLVGASAGWFAALEQAWRTGAATASVEAFDAAVAALADPLDWLAAAGTAPLDAPVGSPPDTWCVPWRQASEDRQLAALAHVRAGIPDGCLWWTQGGARVPPSIRLTHGLPRPEVYAAFVATTRQDDALPADAARGVTEPSPVPVTNGSDDVFSDLLADFDPDTEPAPAGAVGAAAPVPPPPATPAAVDAPAPPGVVCRQDGPATLLVADNGPPDARREAAARVDALLAGPDWWADAEALRERLLALHPALHERREDLIDPVPEDGAVLVASVGADSARVLRVGAASAWHWRRGQLRPLFADAAPPASGQADTVRPGDLIGAAPAVAAGLPGLGAAAAPACAEVTCVVAAGDRLVLLATDTLTRLPAEALAASLTGTDGTQACSRIAAAAGLGSDRTRWPLAVIEVGT